MASTSGVTSNGELLTSYTSQKDSSYIIARWLGRIELQKKFKEIERQYGVLHQETSIFDIFSTENAERQEIARFWDEDQAIPPKVLMSVLRIQATFRIWSSLKKLRNIKRIKHGSEDQVLQTQLVFRRWLTSHHIAKNIAHRENDLKNFEKFCRKIKDGYEVIIYSRKRGQAWKRKMTFNSDFSAIIFSTSLMGKKSLRTTSLYDVKKGPSGYFYPLARPTHKVWCFHLFVLGKSHLDMEACSAEDFKELHAGFKTLITLHMTRSPFYIDENGVPRRAGPSIIDYVLKNKNCRSEADHMRYAEALRQLKSEYKTWNTTYIDERKEWREKRKKEGVTDKSAAESSLIKKKSSKRLVKEELEREKAMKEKKENEEDEEDDDDYSLDDDDDDDDDDSDDSSDEDDDDDDDDSADEKETTKTRTTAASSVANPFPNIFNFGVATVQTSPVSVSQSSKASRPTTQQSKSKVDSSIPIVKYTNFTKVEQESDSEEEEDSDEDGSDEDEEESEEDVPDMKYPNANHEESDSDDEYLSRY